MFSSQNSHLRPVADHLPLNWTFVVEARAGVAPFTIIPNGTACSIDSGQLAAPSICSIIYVSRTVIGSMVTDIRQKKIQSGLMTIFVLMMQYSMPMFFLSMEWRAVSAQ
jgi:hypothetical protein